MLRGDVVPQLPPPPCPPITPPLVAPNILLPPLVPCPHPWPVLPPHKCTMPPPPSMISSFIFCSSLRTSSSSSWREVGGTRGKGIWGHPPHDPPTPVPPRPQYLFDSLKVGLIGRTRGVGGGSRDGRLHPGGKGGGAGNNDTQIAWGHPQTSLGTPHLVSLGPHNLSAPPPLPSDYPPDSCSVGTRDPPNTPNSPPWVPQKPPKPSLQPLDPPKPPPCPPNPPGQRGAGFLPGPPHGLCGERAVDEGGPGPPNPPPLPPKGPPPTLPRLPDYISQRARSRGGPRGTLGVAVPPHSPAGCPWVLVPSSASSCGGRERGRGGGGERGYVDMGGGAGGEHGWVWTFGGGEGGV